VAQVVKLLPNKYKALGSKPSTTKKEEEEEEEEEENKNKNNQAK
jgi:hypothetical protein